MKRILITGSSSGIGQAASMLFLSRGWSVIMADIKENDSVFRELQKSYESKVFFCKCDVSKDNDVRRLFDFAADKTNGVDSIINNAGILVGGLLHQLSEEDWDRLFEVDVKSIFLTSKYFIPYLIKNGGGTIVNTASISGLGGDYEMALYNAAKGAVVNLTRSMALDYAQFGIRVNSVCPGAIDTPLLHQGADSGKFIEEYNKVNPMKRIGSADEVARAMYFLASDESSYCNGANLPVTGGLEAHNGQPHH